MKKLFISQPMRDKAPEEIEAVRESATQTIEELIGEKIEVIDSYFKDEYAKTNNPLTCLGKSIQLLGEADIVYFVKGWDNVRGCRIEYLCATQYGIDVIIEEEQ